MIKKKNVVEILLQHDNKWPHASLETQEAVTKLRQTVPVHPPYSSDLAPSDFHLFGALKNAIYERKFGSDGHRLLKKWAMGHMYSIETGLGRGEMLLCLSGTRLLKFIEINP